MVVWLVCVLVVVLVNLVVISWVKFSIMIMGWLLMFLISLDSSLVCIEDVM